jgi:hypothetical protein
MERYAQLVGKRVEVHYRAADVPVVSAGTLAADNGLRIYLEDRFSSNGTSKTIRHEIPYTHIVRIVDVSATTNAGAMARLQSLLK